MPPADVEVSGLVKRYGGRAVVDGLSLQVERGEVFALLGPNGAGKTTTVEILEGYRAADAGSVRVLGCDPRRQAVLLKPQVGLMLQDGGLYPQITPREALRLFAAFYPAPADVDELIDLLGLGEVANVRFRRLSGGQKQRLNLALAIVGRPRLVFLDEPTASMDPQARHATWSIIRALREQGTTVLLTTHFMDEAEQLADRVAILRNGQLVALGPPEQLMRGAARELRIRTEPQVDAAELADALQLRRDQVARAIEGGIVVHADASTALVLQLAIWLSQRGVLLTQLSTGSRTLEQAFLDLTDASQP
jgi:ABC-2 type transport system ATP-binding protein